MSVRRLVVAPIVVCALVSASAARATPNFPAVIATHLQLGAPPDCTLCHVGTPGRGTVTTPFGKTMLARGVHAYDESSLRTALDAISAEKKDSDGDGTSDVDELRAGQSPNGAGADVVTPEYGCATARSSAGEPWFVAGLTLVVWMLTRSRRRSHGPRRHPHGGLSS